jgi:hypothetical protein
VSYNSGYSEANNNSLDIIYTPNTNQTIKFRVVSWGGSYSSALSRGAGFSRITITQVNQAFSLNAISTLSVGGNLTVANNTTTSTLTVSSMSSTVVAGTLTVTGNILGNVYSVPDNASATWMFLGTWTTVQNGECLYMRIVGHTGYNAVATQNQVTEFVFITSNNSSFISGSTGNYFANGSATVNTRLSGGYSGVLAAPSSIRIVQVSVTSYQIYIYFNGAFMGRTNYSVQIGPATTWTDSSTLVSTPSGNYIDITPSTY